MPDGLRAFLDIPEIKGEGTGPAKDQIELFSFNWGVSRVVTGATGAGSPPGRVAAKDFTITKRADISSSKLIEACTTGQQLKLAKLSVLKGTSGKESLYEAYTLERVLVTNFSVDSAGDTPVESISLNFEKITHNYFGGPAGSNSTTWSLKDSPGK